MTATPTETSVLSMMGAIQNSLTRLTTSGSERRLADNGQAPRWLSRSPMLVVHHAHREVFIGEREQVALRVSPSGK